MGYLIDHQNESPSAVGNPRFGPEALIHYMTNKQVYVDIWDGDSLLHLGVCAIPLNALLRQGRSAVMLDDDLDILWTEVITFAIHIFSFQRKPSQR